MEAKELMENIVKVLDSKKAKDIRAIRIGDLTILGEYFVIATGTSSTQVKRWTTSWAKRACSLTGSRGITARTGSSWITPT